MSAEGASLTVAGGGVGLSTDGWTHISKGSLFISGGGVVTTGGEGIVADSDSVGYASVDGLGSAWNITNRLVVGYQEEEYDSDLTIGTVVVSREGIITSSGGCVGCALDIEELEEIVSLGVV